MPRPLQAARFYAILDTAYVPPDRWESVCRQLIDGGADLIQLRAKQASPEQRAALLERMRPVIAAAGAGAPHLIVNDDVDLAARTPDAGLHIGQDDTPPAEARRRLGPDRLIGLSTHSLDQARAAMALPPGTIDYFCVGPVFSTQTKPDYTP
ncbi:MAG: thiamine phosphate synthase, partial [Verrucomicrobia bacterium]